MRAGSFLRPVENGGGLHFNHSPHFYVNVDVLLTGVRLHVAMVQRTEFRQLPGFSTSPLFNIIILLAAQIHQTDRLQRVATLSSGH